MRELKQILTQIEELRRSLERLINESDDIQDQEILEASTKLDELLNEYHRKLHDKK